MTDWLCHYSVILQLINCLTESLGLSVSFTDSPFFFLFWITLKLTEKVRLSFSLNHGSCRGRELCCPLQYKEKEKPERKGKVPLTWTHETNSSQRQKDEIKKTMWCQRSNSNQQEVHFETGNEVHDELSDGGWVSKMDERERKRRARKERERDNKRGGEREFYPSPSFSNTSSTSSSCLVKLSSLSLFSCLTHRQTHTHTTPQLMTCL